jgi:hypothetical protein
MASLTDKWSSVRSGVPDFSWLKHTKTGKNIPKWPQFLPNIYVRNGNIIRTNGHKIYQHLSLQDTPNFAQIVILGLKIYHLATLGQIIWIEFFRTRLSRISFEQKTRWLPPGMTQQISDDVLHIASCRWFSAIPYAYNLFVFTMRCSSFVIKVFR